MPLTLSLFLQTLRSTCRSRRVKCDENHPVCERCRKGSRDCTYPEHRPAPKSAVRSKREPTRRGSQSSDADASLDEDARDESSRDCELHQQTQAYQQNEETEIETRTHIESSPQRTSHSRAETTSVKLEGSRSPSTEQTSCHSSAIFDHHPPSSSHSDDVSYQSPSQWSYLSDDLQFYLQYHQSNVSFHHYFFKHNANHFLHALLIEQALLYEPLLYAVAGFAAFQCTVRHGRGQLLGFLEYYNKSVSLLRRSLANGEQYTDGTILTVLQLATFEVRLLIAR